MRSSVQLIGYRCVSYGGVGEILIILSSNSNIQCVVGTLFLSVYVYIIAQNVSGLICGADTGVNVNAVQCVAQNTKG